MIKDSVLTSPAIVVSGLDLAGVTLNELVLIGTIGLIILQGVLLSRKIYLSFRKKKNVKKGRSSDG